MREFRPYGSVRGARSNARPYRDSPAMTERAVTRSTKPLILALWVGGLAYWSAVSGDALEGLPPRQNRTNS